MQSESSTAQNAAVNVEQFIKAPHFPCVGAKTAVATGQLVQIQAKDLRCPADDSKILAAIHQYIADSAVTPSLFRSLVASFSGPIDLDETQFETFLWQRLHALHLLDRETFAWDEGVAKDPKDSKFSFSLGGKAFYVVGMHPNSSRPARRLPVPALVFNLHEQFEQLRHDGHYGNMQSLIRRRDQQFNGSINPMLRDFGERSEAMQYSGRSVNESWRCPVHFS